jgi:hypothetical protein
MILKELFSRSLDENGVHADCPLETGFVNSSDNIDAETRAAVASALASANKPLSDRLDVLLALDDEAAFRAELAAILKDEPQLAAAILGSPDIQRMAQAEANGMAAHLLNFLSGKISGGK